MRRRNNPRVARARKAYKQTGDFHKAQRRKTEKTYVEERVELGSPADETTATGDER
jgi:hypothetical protein